MASGRWVSGAFGTASDGAAGIWRGKQAMLSNSKNKTNVGDSVGSFRRRRRTTQSIHRRRRSLSIWAMAAITIWGAMIAAVMGEDPEAVIQTEAFRQFSVRRRTGFLYNFTVPSNPTGFFQAVRLRSGSLRRYGIAINEVRVPPGCVAEPSPERLLVVYARVEAAAAAASSIGVAAALPPGVALASPVFSLLAYNATDAEQVSISATEGPISIRLSDAASGGAAVRCASAAGSAAINITDIVQGGACQSNHFGSFSLVIVNSSSLPPPPMVASAFPVPLTPESLQTKKTTNGGKIWKIIVGVVVGGLAVGLAIFAAALAFRRRAEAAELRRMAFMAEHGEALQLSTVKASRIPTAGDARTKPTRLETDYDGL